MDVKQSPIESPSNSEQGEGSMKERLFVIASQRFGGKTWWIVGEKAGPRSRKYVKTWSFRSQAEAMHLIETLGRLVEDLGHLP